MVQEPGNRPMTTVEMFDELARLGYIVPDNAGHHQPSMPTAYSFVPSITAGSTVPDLEGIEAN